MSDRAQFVLGSVMLALAIGLLVGSVVLPPAAQGAGAGTEGRGFRYGLVTGVHGNAQQSETVYVIDDSNELIMIYEYNPRSRDLVARNAQDMRAEAARLIKLRGHEPKE